MNANPIVTPRPHVSTLSAYQLPDTSSPAGKRQIQLAQNESVFGPSPRVIDAITNAAHSTWLYPDPNYAELIEAIATIHQLPQAQILCGCGSLELINLIASAYLQAGDTAVTSEYGYLFFRTAVKAAEAELLVTAEPSFVVDIDALLAQVQPTTKMLFLANPGNPTGSILPRADILKLRQNLRDDILLIVDEAYAEYVDTDRYEPLFDLVNLGNTVILRTFSKIYGLAGMRIGWGVCPPDVVDMARRIQTPDTVTRLSQIAAEAAIRDQNHIAHVRKETASIRATFTQELTQLGLNPKPSSCNFVLCDLQSDAAAHALSEYLRADGITVRVMGGYGLADHVRITIGTADQMAEVVTALKSHNPTTAIT